MANYTKISELETVERLRDGCCIPVVSDGETKKIFYRDLKAELDSERVTLYETTGQNTDGAMTQKAITKELAKKQDKLTDAQQEVLDSGITSDKVQEIADIEEIIPATASEDNKLADIDFVNSSINSVTAFFVTYNADGDPFPTKAALDSAATFYYAGEPRVPTKNDYCLVNADETHDGAACRYVLQEQNAEMVWAFQYKVNDTPFTAAQLAAINSGITADGLTELQNSKLDKMTNATSNPQVYVKKADGSQAMNSYSSENTASTIMARDANGCTKVAAPTNDAHAATKGYVDAIVGDIETILHNINSGNGGQV